MKHPPYQWLKLFARTTPDAERFEMLTHALFDLMVEVDALRGALAQSEATVNAYRDAYLEATYRAHDASGPSGGIGKTFARFYPRHRSDEPWREELMMERLGLSAEQIEAWKERAAEAELFT